MFSCASHFNKSMISKRMLFFFLSVHLLPHENSAGTFEIAVRKIAFFTYSDIYVNWNECWMHICVMYEILHCNTSNCNVGRIFFPRTTRKTNDDSSVILKTIIYLRMKDIKSRCLPPNRESFFSSFKEANACSYGTLLCFVQSTHFRFIKQNMHCIWYICSCLMRTAAITIFSPVSFLFLQFYMPSCTSNAQNLLNLTHSFTVTLLFVSTARIVCTYSFSFDVYVFFYRVYTISF